MLDGLARVIAGGEREMTALYISVTAVLALSSLRGHRSQIHIVILSSSPFPINSHLFDFNQFSHMQLSQACSSHPLELTNEFIVLFKFAAYF